MRAIAALTGDNIPLSDGGKARALVFSLSFRLSPFLFLFLIFIYICILVLLFLLRLHFIN